MLDLTKIKIVLFDFEDALCVPTDRHKKDESWLGIETYSYCVAPQFMREFVRRCKANGIQMALLSDAVTYKVSEAMLRWVKETYSVDMENYCVNSWKAKAAMLQKLAQGHGLPPRNVLYIDSNSLSLKFATEDGFTACSPSEIAYYMETRK